MHMGMLRFETLMVQWIRPASLPDMFTQNLVSWPNSPPGEFALDLANLTGVCKLITKVLKYYMYDRKIFMRNIEILYSI